MMKELVRDWIPPAILRSLRKVLLADRSTSFQGEFANWEEAQAASEGYDSDNILHKVKGATLQVKHGEAAYERDSVIFDEVQYSWPILASLMSVAAHHQGTLDVLDFGGSLGSSYFQNRKFLTGLTEVSWSVVVQPTFVSCGREYIEDDCIKFYQTIAECLAERKPNVILLSSVLQYLEFPHSVLSDLTNAGAHCLIIDRTPFSESETDRIVVQDVPPQIYPASYPSWLFSRNFIEKNLTPSWNLISGFDCPEGFVRSKFKGFIFESR
jgi:putative methyltransferase (TIGR04325 family)